MNLVAVQAEQQMQQCGFIRSLLAHCEMEWIWKYQSVATGDGH